MQLKPERPASALRERLSLAAVALLCMPATALADSGATNQIDYTTLFYGEESRTQVFEPIVRATRLYADGQSLSAQLGLDVITGASPTGALPSGSVQTVTSPSGRVITVGAGQIPTAKFEDRRFGFDGEWQKPWGRFLTSTVGVHASREKDYRSLGVNGKVSADLFRKLVTVSAGGAYDDDSVFPVGGTPIGLSDGTEVSNRANPKKVKSVLFGVSGVLSRRWIVSLDATRTYENGYLTEPYKVISLINPIFGVTGDTVTDNRPSSRTRSSALVSSVYHLTRDILYVSYRYYEDTWGVHSNTFDLKYRRNLDDDWYVEPHLRFYRQGAADFYTTGLYNSLAFPEFATSDYRLGRLTTLTIGADFAFHAGDSRGLWTLRAEYIRQAGDNSPPAALAAQGHIDVTPAINTVTAVVGYSFNF